MSNFNKAMHIVRWVERTRRLHKLFAIPPSCDVAFARSERKLHYDFAKLKVRSRLLKLFNTTRTSMHRTRYRTRAIQTKQPGF